jgi:ATP-binding cassette subfamily B protein
MTKRKPKKQYYSLRSFLRYMARFKLRFVIVFACFIIADLMLAVIPVYIGKLVGALAAPTPNHHQVIVLTIVLIALSSGHNLAWRFSEFVYLKLVKALSYTYENILFQKVISRPYPYFVDKFTGKVASYITNLSQELRDFIENLCYNYTAQAVSLVALIFILASINWQTGVIFITGLIGMYLVGRHTIKNSAKYEGLLADTQSTKNGKIIDTIANFVNVKSFHKEREESAIIASEQTKTLKRANQSYVWSMWFWASMSFFVRDLIWTITIVMNVYLFLHHQLSITQLATLLSAILLFSTTVWEGVWYLSQFNLRLSRMEEAHVYLFGKTIIDTTSDLLKTAEPTKHLNESLALDHISFAYPDKADVDVLTDISLTIRKGEKIGIVGKSGSGKTTLTKLLLDYYEIKSGSLRLDGEAVNSAVVSQLISYVPQDTSLFHRTIAENIAYATSRPVTRNEVVNAAKQAHADEFIAKISGGYDTLVGERGVKLSAGQRQRIAIARAFLDNKPILILDEATSALDSESEVLVQEALEALWQHKTVIAIAHRLSTLRNMDRVLVIDKGRIAESGSHDELLAKKGLYAKLWAHQSGGFLED